MPYTTLFRSDRHHPHRPRQVPPRNASPDAHSSSRGTESRTPARASDRSPCRSWPDHRYGGRVVLDSKAYLNRSEEHTSELQSLMRKSYAVFCLKKKIIVRAPHSLYVSH